MEQLRQISQQLCASIMRMQHGLHGHCSSRVASSKSWDANRKVVVLSWPHAIFTPPQCFLSFTSSILGSFGLYILLFTVMTCGLCFYHLSSLPKHFSPSSEDTSRFRTGRCLVKCTFHREVAQWDRWHWDALVRDAIGHPCPEVWKMWCGKMFCWQMEEFNTNAYRAYGFETNRIKSSVP